MRLAAFPAHDRKRLAIFGEDSKLPIIMTYLTASARTLGSRVAVLILGLLLALPVAAQTPEPPPADPAPQARQALIDILRDDTAREALIAELEALAEPEAIIVAEAQPQISVARRVAMATQDAAETVTARAVEIWTGLLTAPDRLRGFGLNEATVLVAAFGDLFIVIVATVAGFIVLRALARILYRRMGERYRLARPLARWAIYAAAELVDVGIVVLAWALGYVIAATVVGGFGEVAILHTLYLNAFLVVELVKVVLRAFISPNATDLRPLALSDDGAQRFYRVLNLAVSLLGYGLLLLVPIVNANASFAAGRTLSAIVSVAAVLFLAGVVLRYRHEVADWLRAQGRRPLPPADAIPPDAATPDGTAPDAVAPEAEPVPDAARADAPGPDDEGEIVIEQSPGADPHLAREPKRAGLYETLANNWHWIALLWLGWILLSLLVRTEEAVLGAVRLSLAAGGGVVLAVVVSGMLGRSIGRGISLPEGINARLPRLQPRLNGFVPQLLVVFRAVAVAAILFGAVWIGGAATLGQWLLSPVGLGLLGTVISVLLILSVAFLLWLALTSWVEYRLNPDFGAVPTAREQTLLTLLRNALTIVLLVITLMFALSEIGLNIGPLIASAGVIGLAIGFGAQKLVQDVITGIFIQFENAMNVGDVVTAGTTTGVVEKLTIRSVSLRDLNGIYHVIPFSSVDAVSNFTRDFSHYVLDMGVAYREDVEEVKVALFDAFEELRRDPEHGPNILADMEWFGINEFADSAVIVRARVKTLPGKQWNTGRAFNGIIKRVFDARGIEIPFPHTTLYFGENKKGETQPIRLEDSRRKE